MNNEKGITLIGILISVILLALFLVKFSQLGEGTHSGYITAVDQRGYIFRNYDVYFKTDNSSSQEDLYCIHRKNTDIIEKAKELSEEREQVTIHYKGVRGIGFGLCGHTEIKNINKLKP